jgi:hypothetical protein
LSAPVHVSNPQAARVGQRPHGPRRHRSGPGRPWFVWTVGGLIGVVGFAAVLWLTAPTQRPPPAVGILAGLAVSDMGTLMRAVQTAGLRGSSDIRGAIERIARQDDGRVLIKGWVADIAAKGTPLTVLAFTDGKNVWTTTAGGPRQDLWHALGLSDAVTNPSFQGSLPCGHGRALIVIAVAPGNTYSQFASLTCP